MGNEGYSCRCGKTSIPADAPTDWLPCCDTPWDEPAHNDGAACLGDGHGLGVHVAFDTEAHNVGRELYRWLIGATVVELGFKPGHKAPTAMWVERGELRAMIRLQPDPELLDAGKD